MHKGLEAGCKKPARPTARDGRLMGRPALRANRGENAREVAEAAAATAQSVSRPVPPLPAATIEETERIADWLESDGVRIIEIDGDWSWPLHLGHRLTQLPSPLSDDVAAGEALLRDAPDHASRKREAAMSP